MDGLVAWAREAWPYLVTLVHVVGATWVTVDAALRKRHVTAIVGWVGLAWLAPVTGAIAYYLLGINRIRRSASRLDRASAAPGLARGPEAAMQSARPAVVAQQPSLEGLLRLGDRLVRHPLHAGNRVEPLVDGDAAYPAMLAAIDGARRSVSLVSYIFDNDVVGREFCAALARARGRGVEVRVLVDDVGARYSRPTILRELAAAGVPAAGFLPTRTPRLFKYANLRNHRKIMVVDGRVAYTGGMNIRAGHWRGRKLAEPVRCVHFRVAGPVVADLQAAFVVDWAFTTGERLEGSAWFAAEPDQGHVAVRGVPDGPDDDIDNLPQMLIGALAVATRRVRIATPYFLPEDSLFRALQVAALRGVEVDIVVPARSNVPVMDWAMAPQFPWLVDSGCRVYRTAEPFDHSKLLVIDGAWSMIGSTNWDARSLRLNFEYNLECYDSALAARLEAVIDAKITTARRMDGTEFARQPFLLRLRDALARLFSPYL